MSPEPEPQKRFHHIGLRAFEPQPNEDHVAPSKCWVTNPAHDPNRIEWLRYAPDSPIDPEFMNFPHICYTVDELGPILKGRTFTFRRSMSANRHSRALPSPGRTASSSNT